MKKKLWIVSEEKRIEINTEIMRLAEDERKSKEKGLTEEKCEVAQMLAKFIKMAK